MGLCGAAVAVVRGPNSLSRWSRLLLPNSIEVVWKRQEEYSQQFFVAKKNQAGGAGGGCFSNRVPTRDQVRTSPSWCSAGLFLCVLRAWISLAVKFAAGQQALVWYSCKILDATERTSICVARHRSCLDRSAGARVLSGSCHHRCKCAVHSPRRVAAVAMDVHDGSKLE